MKTLRLLGVVAIVLGAGAAVVGSPYSGAKGQIDVDALARVVTREDDHVTAVELAGWIRERRRGVRIVDVRSPKEFDDYHIPTSERIPLDSLSRARLDPNETIVLYSGGGAHAAQAWVFLRALGYRNVFFLRGGLNEWLEDVMSPTSTDTIVSELSRYFGGAPHVGERPPATLARIRRRGC